MSSPQPLTCPLETYAVIGLTGPDTDKLLQGQLTCDINQLSTERPLAGALCTVKGRMISSLYLFRADDTVLIAMRQELLEATLAHLRKYAVFYKTQINDVSNDYQLIGLIGVLPAQALPIPPLTLASDLHLLACRRDSADTLLARSDTIGDSHHWYRAAIANGIGEVRGETREEFIPQMLNFQHTGAVNFRKGCYTGQEIVARMQYLGKLKRRMYRIAFNTTEPPASGAEIQLPDGTQNVGHLVLAETSGDIIEALAVLTAEAAQAPQLNIAGQTLAVQVLPLPYDDKFGSDTGDR